MNGFEIVIQFLREINIAQLIPMGVMFWFFYSRLNSKIEKLDVKIEKLDVKLSDRIDKLDTKISDRIDKLDIKVTDIDKRVFAIETMLHMKDCCMLKDDRQLKKAE